MDPLVNKQAGDMMFLKKWFDGLCKRFWPQRMVVGFLFNHGKTHVVLIFKKNGPKVLHDRWNGPGGKVEKGETPHEAMVREFKEETGLSVPHWENFLIIKPPGKEIFFFRAEGDVEKAKTQRPEEGKGEERVEIHFVDHLSAQRNLFPDLDWQILLGKSGMPSCPIVMNYDKDPLKLKP